MQKNDMKPNLPLTLEQHFQWLANGYSEVQELHSLWLLLRKDLEDRLPHSRGIFVHYSLHDATHSRSVIRAIERFLGDERIARLSATDTFMLLTSAYAHDYGMAMTFNQIYDALGDPHFIDFLTDQGKIAHTLGEEDAQAIKNLLSYVRDKKASATLQEQYFAIMVVIQMYLRPTHWMGAKRVWGEFKGLLEGRLNGRFIQGGEGVIDICEAHGKSFENLMKMSIRADGIIGDEFHPRFIAAMLRLGDLLDLDNGRFPRWFVDEIGRNRGLIPQLSKLHYKKHEAISHLLITPKRIEVCAACNGENGYEVADLVSEWIEWLKNECTNQILYWSEITQTDFGRPPRVKKSEIMVNGKIYISDNRKLQMRMSQDRVMKLLEGTSIYRDRYVGIRELVQNAVDASLLQLWDDITHNRYINLGVFKHGHKLGEKIKSAEEKSEMQMLEHGRNVLNGIFGNYEITVELIQDMVDQKVYIVVKDKGIGITPKDAKYISDIGTSKEKNERIVEIMKDMPRWLKPSGVFGIGLQSVFQLTDRIEFYTRRPNEPERMIVFHSYGRNHGKIQIQEVPADTNGIYHDNAVPGTNVKIAIDPKKLLSNEKGDHFLYYDKEFDSDDVLHSIFVELSQEIVEKLKESPCDYFNVYFQQIKRIAEDKPLIKYKRRRLRCSYFSPHKDENAVDEIQEKMNVSTIVPFYEKTKDHGETFAFTQNMAYYTDNENCRVYRFTLRTSEIFMADGKEQLRLPAPVHDLYHFQYKFNTISDAESIYPLPVRKLRNVHAGFLSCDINIMDDAPTKYLNIDRDRLRDGAVMEEELAGIRTMVLERWCDYLISHYKTLEEKRIAKEKQARAKLQKVGREDAFIPERNKNPFEKEAHVLVSLALLFYQNVSSEKFKAFIKPHTDFLEKQHLILEDENFCVQELWKEDAEFCSEQNYPSEWAESMTPKGESVEENYTPLHLNTVLRLPHRLIHIFKISLGDNNNLGYKIKLGPPSPEPYMIEMDDAAKLLDYSGALDAAFIQIKEKDTVALVRRVFKPNKAFPHIIIAKYPKNFRRDRNFSSPLDHCIRWYILSPFDRDLVKWLKQTMAKDRREINEILDTANAKVKEYAASSEQFQKCVQYVLKQHKERAQALNQTLEKDIEDTIKAEYTSFLLDCCTTLITHRDLIIPDFQKGMNQK